MEEVKGNRKFKISGIVIVGMLLCMLAGCGSPKPTDAVDGFLTSIQKGEFEKAGTYADGGTDSLKADMDTASDDFTASLIEAISKSYKFEKPEEVSVNGDKAVVKVKITSLDFGDAMTATLGEVMPLAFASAFEEQTPESEKAFEALTEKTALKHLKKKDATMATRTVKLNLEKNKEGEYKIVSDDSLTESIFANVSQLEDMFGEDTGEEEAEEPQPEQTSEMVTAIAKEQTYDMNPIKMNIEEISIKKATNVSEEEQENISYYTDKEIGKEFNYISIKFNVENTSDEDFNFGGISEVILFSEGKQEVIDTDFIMDDEANEPEYYGKVSKQGNAGFVFDFDPNKVNKVRVKISNSMHNDTYDGGTEEKVVEFDLTQN